MFLIKISELDFDLIVNDPDQTANYEDALMLLICEEFSPACYFGTCDQCPGRRVLRERLLALLNKGSHEIIKYKQWVSKPQCTLDTIECSILTFVDNICQQAQLLSHYVAKQQSSYLNFVKQNLKSDECAIICDFAENYAFIVQNAASGFYWNNNQATVFTAVVYYCKARGLQHRSLCIISDCLNHDAVAVYMFLKELNVFIRSFVATPSKFFYFSDGVPQQFKNYKNFSTLLLYYEKDFGVPAE